MILSALEGVIACLNVCIHLSVYAVSIGHIVCGVSGIPLGTEMSACTSNGECGGSLGLGIRSCAALCLIAESKGAVLVYGEGKLDLNTAGNMKLVSLGETDRGIIKNSLGNLGAKPALSHIPLSVVACLYAYVAALVKGSGNLTVYELVIAEVLVIILTAVVSSVDIADKIIIDGYGSVSGIICRIVRVYGRIIGIHGRIVGLKIFVDLNRNCGSCKSNGESVSLSGEGDNEIAILISSLAYSAVAGIPIVILYALKGISACGKILVGLGICTCSLVKGHIVCSVACIPSGAAKFLNTCNGEGRNCLTNGTLAILILMACRHNDLGIVLTALRALIGIGAILCAGCCNRLGSLALGRVIAAVGIIVPCANTPLTRSILLGEIVSVYSSVKLDVNGLFGAVIEDNVFGGCRYADSIDILTVVIGAILFHSSAGPSHRIAAGAPIICIHLGPALIIGEIDGSGLFCLVCRKGGDSSKAHYHRKNEDNGNQDFACVFHRIILPY